MTVSQTPSSVAERRLAIARRLFRAMVAKDPDRSITLFDSRGEVVARHDPLEMRARARRGVLLLEPVERIVPRTK